MLDTQKALKTPKTDEYYENYDRIFGSGDETGGHKTVPDMETNGLESNLDEPES